jgi:hypothetical protein
LHTERAGQGVRILASRKREYRPAAVLFPPTKFEKVAVELAAHEVGRMKTAVHSGTTKT